MNEIRLIEANALKEKIDFVFPYDPLADYEENIGEVMKLIDNAPTVFSCNACKNMGNERECVDCHDYSNYVHYEERPQGKFTDLERKVIADSINYLLGAELLEENGYTEEVVNALKSVLQKIGAEENHL